MSACLDCHEPTPPALLPGLCEPCTHTAVVMYGNPQRRIDQLLLRTPGPADFRAALETDTTKENR